MIRLLLAALLLTGCTSMLPNYRKYYQAQAQLQARSLAVSYSYAHSRHKHSRGLKNLVTLLRSTASDLSNHLGNYESLWQRAIYNNVYRYSRVTFTQALAIARSAYLEQGVNERLEKVMDLLKSKLTQLPHKKYPSLDRAYVIVAQMSQFAQDPSGSLKSFRSTVRSLKLRFQTEMAAADLVVGRLERTQPRKPTTGAPTLTDPVVPPVPKVVGVTGDCAKTLGSLRAVLVRLRGHLERRQSKQARSLATKVEEQANRSSNCFSSKAGYALYKSAGKLVGMARE